MSNEAEEKAARVKMQGDVVIDMFKNFAEQEKLRSEGKQGRNPIKLTPDDLESTAWKDTEEFKLLNGVTDDANSFPMSSEEIEYYKGHREGPFANLTRDMDSAFTEIWCEVKEVNKKYSYIKADLEHIIKLLDKK